MIVSWNWLKNYVPLNMDRSELEHRLAMSGLNHEGTEGIGDDWANVVQFREDSKKRRLTRSITTFRRVGKHYRRAFEEQNLGLPVESALGKLTERMPLLDVQFFVAAGVMNQPPFFSADTVRAGFGQVGNGSMRPVRLRVLQ